MKKAIITAASNMSDETYNILCERAKRKFGEDMAFERHTDDSVIGGFIMNLDGLVYDLSIKTQLEEMKKHLTT